VGNTQQSCRPQTACKSSDACHGCQCRLARCVECRQPSIVAQPALVSEVLHHPNMDKMLDVYSAITEVPLLFACVLCRRVLLSESCVRGSHSSASAHLWTRVVALELARCLSKSIVCAAPGFPCVDGLISSPRVPVLAGR